MYLGQIVEEADVNSLFDNPMHPYTMGLLKSIPKMEGERDKRLFMIEGMVPLLSQIPEGCRFRPRCPYATEECAKVMPELTDVNGHQTVRCLRTKEIHGEAK